MKKFETVKYKDVAHTVIYEVKINYDSKAELFFGMFLLGDNVSYSKTSGKKQKWWNRFFEAPTEQEVLDLISNNLNWDGATNSKGKIVTSEDVLSLIDKEEKFTDAFYSYFYLRPEYENNEDREKVEVLFTAYNTQRTLFPRSKTDIKDEMSQKLKEIFRTQKATHIQQFIFHAVKTDVKELKKMEVI